MSMDGDGQVAGEDVLAGCVRALRDALPGIHAWFPEREQVQAAAVVLTVGLADLRERVAVLRRVAQEQVDEADGDLLREALALGMRASLDDVIALIDAEFRA